MKKILSLILALAMVMSLSVTAFAAESPLTYKSAGDYEIDISAAYQAGDAADVIVSVDIEWGAMTFTYHDAVEGQWSAENHSYTGGGTAYWDANGNTITVKNHSNSEIKATFTYTKAITSVIGTFSKDSMVLETAVGTDANDPPKDETTLTLSGTLDSSYTTSTKVGTVTVSIAQNS